jgi:hypothetical protein
VSSITSSFAILLATLSERTGYPSYCAKIYNSEHLPLTSKALSSTGNPQFTTIMKVMKALGLRLHATAL